MRPILQPSTLRPGLWALCGLALVLALPPGLAEPRQALIDSVDCVGITVSDMDRALDFYSRVLNFEKVSDTELDGEDYEHLEGVFGSHVRVARMQLGNEFIELTEYLTPQGRPIPIDLRSNDRWSQHVAIVVSGIDQAYRRLRDYKVAQASSRWQRLPDWNKNAAGIAAFYFKDPDGHPLEILQFPADKGLEKWHHAPGKLFLGIDHTAIVVSDTEASLRFYRDLLGMGVAGESENYGTEQEHLNNVFGAHLRITALRASTGPGIELLEYLAPRDGRPFPADERANDIVHRQTLLVTRDADGAARQLRLGKVSFISSSVIHNQNLGLGFQKAFLVRDPDGHAIELEQK